MPGPVLDPGKIPGKVFIPNCLALRLLWLLPNGKQASNVMHTVYDGSPALTQAVVDAYRDAVMAALTASGLLPFLHDTTALTGIGIRDMSESAPGSGVGHGEFVALGTAANGTAPGTEHPLPSNVSFVVSLKSPTSGQQGRGRVYIPGWSAGANDAGGHVLGTAADAAVAFIQGIQTFSSATTYGWPVGIAHPHRQAYTSSRTGVSYPDRPAGVLTVVSISRRDLIWDTQRLRVRI